MIAFNDMKEIEKNDTTWIELDQDKHTKDKKVMLKKVNYIESLLKDFLHIKEDDSVENNEVESKVDEIQTEEFEKKVEETIDDTEMETLDFVRKYVDPEITEEDIDCCWDYINSCVSKTKIIKATSEMLAPENENSMMAMIAWADKENKNIATWLQRFSITHKTMSEMSQKQRFEFMVKNFLKFETMQMRMKSA